VLLNAINYLLPGWYEATAGVVTFPRGRTLTRNELSAIRQTPLILAATSAGGATTVAISEAPNGTYLRADTFVFRLNPGDTVGVRLFASKFGQPYEGARVISVFDPSQLQAAEVATPIDIVDFPALAVAGKNGVADLVIKVGDPGPVRGYIDGQVYGVRSFLEEDLDYGAGYNFSPWDFVSLLVWSGFPEENPPTWHGSIEPIFHQYANLYPVMKPVVDLKNYDSVCANVHILRLAFGLPVEDPNSMPVTRDLSDARRKAILRWLSEPGPDGKLIKGTPGTSVTAVAATRTALAEADDAPLRGGKATAASRRLMLRNTVTRCGDR
jgi:hypothetical protein